MRRAPKQPKRVRSIVRAAQREAGAPVFVAEAQGRPSRLLNVHPEGGELVPGLGVLPGHRPRKPKPNMRPEQTRALSEEEAERLRRPGAVELYGGQVVDVPDEERDDHAFGDVSDELEEHARAIDARMDALEERGGGLA